MRKQAGVRDGGSPFLTIRGKLGPLGFLAPSGRFTAATSSAQMYTRP